MLRFNIKGKQRNRHCLCISIHLMLRFNSSLWANKTCKCGISIHLMLRFNHVGLIFVRMILLFQYILCCGSTFSACSMFSSFLRISIHLMLRFNFTSLYKSKVFLGISIHLMLRFNYGFCRRCNWSLWISIHLMLRFNSASFVRVAEAGKFQYILCCGSTSCFKK